MSAAGTTPPATLPVRVDGVPSAMTERRQWVGWGWEWVPPANGKPGHWTKVPINVHTRGRASSTNPATWAAFGDALAYADVHGLPGVGYVFAADDPFCGVDFDKCRREDGEIYDEVRDDLAALDTYAEWSCTDTGIHAIAKAGIPRGRKKPHLEMYDQGRFFTVTGHRLDWLPPTIEPRHEIVNALHLRVFGPEDLRPNSTNGHHDTADLTDGEIIRLASEAESGDKFRRLFFDGDSRGYPSQSEADAALCAHLAFWTVRNAKQMDRLFRRSELMRDKWDTKHYGDGRTYGQGTIDAACRFVAETYTPPGPRITGNGKATGHGETSGTGPHNSRNTHNTEADSNSGYSQDSGDAPWELPTELEDLPVPAFPVDIFPSWVADFVTEEAEATQTPPDLAGMLSLSALSVATAKKVEVHVRDGWREPLNTYTATALGSGNRKTAVFKDITEPIEAYDAEQIAAAQLAIAKAENDRKIAEASLARAQKEAATATGPERANALLRAEAEAIDLAAMKIPVIPRLLADDVSPEKAASMLADQDGRLGILSDEGGIFDLMAGRYSANNTPNLDVFLKGHAGGTIRIDRVGRRSEYVHEAALTMGLAIQPFVIAGLVERPAFRGRGLLARNAYSMPESSVGRRMPNPAPMTKDTRETYRECLTALLELPMGDRSDKDGHRLPHALFVSDAAHEVLVRFQEEIEPNLGEFGELGHIADWGSKLPGLAVRIAGLLHLGEYAGEERPWDRDISPRIMARAVSLARDYLIPHALAAFALMGADVTMGHAKYILRWIERNRHTAFTKRDLYQAAKRRFRRVDELDAPLDTLIRHGYIRLRTEQDEAAPGDESQKKTPGRKPSPTYDVNPLWCPHNPRNTHNSYSGYYGDSEDASTEDYAELSRGFSDKDEAGDGRWTG